MDTNEIFNYMKTGTAWLVGGGFVYFTAIVGLQATSIRYSEKIKSQKQLDIIIEEESKKLNLKNVIGIFYKNRRESSAEEYTKKICGIKIGEIYATRGIVKHELYHIYKHHFFPNKTKKIKQKFLNLLKYLFVMESQATIYEVFGIKL